MHDRHAHDQTSRQRFLAEAEITGGLEHPGIVPVYGLGSYADGRPYYAMRFIQGDSLKEAIERFHRDESLKKDAGRRSLALRKLLRRFTDVCNAIEYAHSRGVVHRDIKPGNIIVGRHGETLVVDWGLAKAIGRPDPGADANEHTLVPSSASGSAETLPGQALGTPAYMSPEQARGDLEALGPRSDVYSLGATLYCLLTGKPPFEGDVADLLRKVQQGDFRPPRQVDPSIDKALDAVCLKAMSLRPENRYATARALVEDVERWLADEPVTAWREPIAWRARRWARRNRTAVSVAAASLLVAFAGLTAVIAVQNQANAALTDANRRLESANRREVKANTDLKAANERERSRFALAQEAIRTFHTGVSEDLLLKQKEFTALRTKLLRGARDFYQKLERLLEGHADRESRVSLGRAYREVGELSAQIDTIRDGLTMQRRALAMFEDLAREAPGDSEIRRDLGRSWLAVGLLMLRTDGGTTDGFANLDRAREAFRSAAAAHPADVEDGAALARIQSFVADYHHNQGHDDAALKAISESCENFESLYNAGVRSENVRFGYASSLDTRGLILKNLERFDEALESFAKARRLSEELVRDFPAEHRYGNELIRTLGNMGLCLTWVRRFDEASARLEQAKAVIQTITEASPTLLEAQRNLIWIESLVAPILIRTDRDEEAIPVLERVRVGREAFIKLNPDDVRHQQQLAWVLRTQAACYVTLGKYAQARPVCQRALAVVQRTAEANPKRHDVQVELAGIYCTAGEIESLDNQPDRARGYFEQAMAIRQKRLDADPSDEPSIAFMADSLRRIGTTLEASGRPADAIAHYRRSIAMLESLKKPLALDLYDIACCHSLISGAAQQAESGMSSDQASAAAERAVAGVRQACAAGYRNYAWIRKRDTDLKPIRSRADFQALIMDLAMPADPFASAK
jgi:serine/threonine-protein kinase